MTNSDKLYENIFINCLNLSYVLYIIILLGISSYAPKYLEYLKTFLQYFVGGILFIRYNPITYKEKKFGDFDRRLVFYSSIFILLSTSLIKGIEEYFKNESKKLIQKGYNIISNDF